MKLVIQIPAFNEADTIGATIRDLPSALAGIDEIAVLVLDDGSTDGTSEAARAAGATAVARWPQNRGLAYTFRAGLDRALELGADLVVHTDADNQYQAADIQALVDPILAGRAEIVVGCRDMDAIPHFSTQKRALQRLGSRVVRAFSGTDVPDATSGFRAYSREAAIRLNVVSSYTYTLETLIQAGREGLALEFVPIRTNPKTRESRLMRSQWNYIARSVATILRISILYRPLQAFALAGLALIVPAMLIGLRFLAAYFSGTGSGHVQSLILAAILTIVGIQVIVMGVIADLQGANRRLLSDLLARRRREDAERRAPRADA